MLVLNKLGVKADEAVYVGDMADDVIFARRAGVMPVVVYRNNAAYHPRSYLEDESPEFIIDDLKELTKIVSH